MTPLRKDFCWWCSKPVKVRADTPKTNSVFCEPKCFQLDHMFKLWQSDKYLNYLTQTMKEDKDGETPR